MKQPLAAVLLSVTVAMAVSAHERDPGDAFVVRDVYLMGTRARLAANGNTREAGLTILDSALRVLEETERELSTWQADSAISALNRQPIGAPWHAESAGLCSMFEELYGWQKETGGTFDPAIGALLAAWDVHGNGRIPAADEMQRARANAGLALMAFDKTNCTLTRLADVAIDVGAFGKGAALDRVERVLPDVPWMIDLGGQVSVHGPSASSTIGNAWPVDLADPGDRTRPVMQLEMRDGSLSTSAGSERDLLVDGTRVGHILDPRTGSPAPFHGSVTVWHHSGLAADVLSTALYVMGPEAGLQWAEARGLSVCYLIPSHGALRVSMTTSFRRLVVSFRHA